MDSTISSKLIPPRQSGFTLLEVLVTLIILAIGLLGLAGLQAAGLKNNHNAYLRSQATQSVYDVIDRMRSNKTSINDYLTSNMDPSVATVQNDCITSSTSCTASNMAEHDLYEWYTAITATLPGASESISASGANYSVVLSWDDRDGNAANNPNFQVNFQP